MSEGVTAGVVCRGERYKGGYMSDRGTVKKREERRACRTECRHTPILYNAYQPFIHLLHCSATAQNE